MAIQFLSLHSYDYAYIEHHNARLGRDWLVSHHKATVLVHPCALLAHFYDYYKLLECHSVCSRTYKEDLYYNFL
jgi:hypothetical protein